MPSKLIDVWQYVLMIPLLIGSMLLYFQIADKFNIIDNPNDRSSHTIPTIRGAGILVLIAILCWFFLNSFGFPYFVAGCLLIGFISFLDDLKPQPSFLRFAFQLISFTLLGFQVNLFQEPVILLILVFIIGMGTLNAFNFMDGINGITGVYAFVNLVTFYFINENVVAFTKTSLILYLIAAVLVFLFFNFRKRARCFAGDVGSVSLAFVQVFFCLQLMLTTSNYCWILLFLLFGADSVITILYRIKKRENIFKPHRSHLYQYLANEMQLSHRFVSLLYGILQVLVNVIVIQLLFSNSYIAWVAMLVVGGLLMILTRQIILNRVNRLKSVE